jgi:hypothetical protein
MPMIAMTTSNSTSVKPDLERMGELVFMSTILREKKFEKKEFAENENRTQKNQTAFPNPPDPNTDMPTGYPEELRSQKSNKKRRFAPLSKIVNNYCRL